MTPELGALAYGVELSEPNRIALIVGFERVPGLHWQEQMTGMAERVRSMPQGGDLSPPAIGVGTLFEGASRLNQSYIEALSAFESRLHAGPGSTSYFASISDPQERAFCLPHSLLIKLTQSLKQGSLDVTMPTIGQCFAWLQSSGASMPLMRAMCYDILNTMLKTRQ